MKLKARGQSIIEYTMIIGIITMVLFYMGTGIKRGVQSLVKVTADQVGNQQNSDQDFNDTQSGYMEASNSSMQTVNNKRVTAIGYIDVSGNAVYIANTAYNNYSDSITNSITNGGFSPTSSQ
jgi:Flp pilus assembly pilin Flp